MNIEDLQREWQAVKTEPRSHSDLRRMMYTPRAQQMRSMPWKEIFGISLSLAVLLAFTLVFGFLKDWSTGILIPVAIIEILDQYLGLRYLRLLPQRDTIRKTFVALLFRAKLVLLLSRLAHAGVWLAVVLIAGTKMQLGFWSTVALGLASLPLVFLVSRWRSRKWSLKVADVNALLEELNLDEEPEIAVGT